jgi:hypothetical protein
MMDERNRERLEAMDPEKRAKVEALRAKINTPERRAARAAAAEAIEREVRETGGITAMDGTFHKVKMPEPVADENAYQLVAVGAALRERRKTVGKSLEALASESGIDQGMLSRIERGAVPNPTVGTLNRVAAAVGGRITIGFEAVEGAD